MVRKLLLNCGILFFNVLCLRRRTFKLSMDGYNYRDQTISELGTIGAPSGALFVALLVPTYLLLGDFGVGLWQAAGTQRRLRIVGGLRVSLAILALGVGMFVQMREHGVEQGIAGAFHLIEGGVAMALLFMAMGIAASTLGRVFVSIR